jgi:hypothetical protein
MTDFVYIPILKLKLGERTALFQLTPADKAKLRPLLEVLPESRKKKPAKVKPGGPPPPTHAELIAKQVAEAWGTETPIFIDCVYLLAGLESSTTATTAITDIFDAMRSAKVQAIPVFTGHETPSLTTALRAIIATDGRGGCLRAHHQLPKGATIHAPLGTGFYTRSVANLGLSPAQTDLLVDMGIFIPGMAASHVASVRGILSGLPSLPDWRNIAVAGTAFPKSFAGLANYSTNTYERTEWLVWDALRRSTKPNERMPLFADYAINHPGYLEFDPVKMQLNGHIRYTTPTQFLYAKGQNLTTRRRKTMIIHTPGAAQFRGIAASLVTHPDYSGPGFSAGDQYIDDVANSRTATPGSPTTWRRAGTNHHLTLVVRQVIAASGSGGGIANLFAPSGPTGPVSPALAS